jgi:hypothetical protein
LEFLAPVLQMNVVMIFHWNAHVISIDGATCS